VFRSAARDFGVTADESSSCGVGYSSRVSSPPKYRPFVDAYFEALSKAATGKAAH